MTHEAVKAAWYSPCAGRSLGGVSGRSLGGKVRWVVGWVCGRMFSWCEMVKAWIWGRVMEFCSGCEWVWARGDPWVIAGKFWNGPELGDVEGILVRNFQLDPSW